MKITAGFGAIEDYEPLADAGADELFCGFVPFSWWERYGVFLPMNRREALYPDMQLTGWQDLTILARKQARRGVPVVITLNSPFYAPEQYPILYRDALRILETGFPAFIVADPALLVYFAEKGFPGKLYLSGEAGEINAPALDFFVSLGISRLIFHRKVTTNEMDTLIRHAPNLEYEAFVLNENCHFSQCLSLHCDEMPPLCRVPYLLAPMDAAAQVSVPEEIAPFSCADLGGTGCALCRLGRLEKIGITHGKLVGRGNTRENLVRDLLALKKALSLSRRGVPPENIRSALFPEGCPQTCYYQIREERSEKPEI